MIKSNYITQGAMAVFCAVVVLSYQNCSGYKSSSSDDVASVTQAPDTEVIDKKPLLSCAIKDSTGRILRRISNISNSDETSALISEGQEVTFDCSSSLNYQGTYNITNYAVDFGAGKVSNTTGVFKYTFAAANTYSLNFELKDRDGNILNKIIRILVRCSSASASSLVVNSSAISASPHAVPGFFVYSANGAVTGGKPPYSYAWDFNGDSIIDQQPLDDSYMKWQVWRASSTSIPVHNLYSNLRRVTMIVKDSCNFTKVVEKEIQFTLPRVAAGEFPMPKEFYYLQADIARTNPLHARRSINMASSVDLNSIGSPLAPDIGVREHVKCRYQRDKVQNKAGLSVIGENAYANYALRDSEHGMSLFIQGITDNGALGLVVDRVSFPLERADFYITQSQEVTTAYNFEKNATCSMSVRVERGLVNAYCSNAPNIQKTMVSITGEGSCSNLENQYAGSISAENIKFFCSQVESDRCPPGVIIGGPDPIGY